MVQFGRPSTASTLQPQLVIFIIMLSMVDFSKQRHYDTVSHNMEAKNNNLQSCPECVGATNSTDVEGSGPRCNAIFLPSRKDQS